MQANCLIFPSPQKYNIEPIKQKIVLIPQDSQQFQHLAYHDYCHFRSYQGQDDLQKTIMRLNQHMFKTRDQSGRYSKGAVQMAKAKQKQAFMNQNTFKNQNQHNQFKNEQLKIPNTINKKCSQFSDFSDKNQSNKGVYEHQSERLNTRNYSKSEINQNSQRSDLKNQQNKNNKKNINQLETEKPQATVNSQQYIPCLFLPGKRDKIIVFFHANAEDITSSLYFLQMINLQTQYSILAMEYRGYSINKGQTNPQKINLDAQRVLNYLYSRNIESDQIIIFGRSIGCAVALSILKKHKFFCIVLLSPFLSLKKIAKQLYGNCAGWALKEGFNNQENALNIQCPLLLIHGMKDNLVPYQHSMALLSQCKAFCQLKLIQNMTHSKFNFKIDFINHFVSFVNDLTEQYENQQTIQGDY